MWRRYDYTLFWDEELAAIAEELRTIVARRKWLVRLASDPARPAGVEQVALAGGTIMTRYDSFAVEEREVVLREAFHTAVVRLLDSVGVNADGQSRTWVNTQVLVAEKGNGAQMLHNDSACCEPHHIGSVQSCLLFCAPVSQCTMLPRFPREYSRLLGAVHQDTALRRAVLALLDSELYHSVGVRAGTLVVFQHSTPHAGSANCSSKHLRTVLFDERCVLSVEAELHKQQQFFQWHWYRDAYRTQQNRGRSREYFHALKEAKARGFDPIGREKDAPALEAWYNEQIQLPD
jgi:hypothetical protein